MPTLAGLTPAEHATLRALAKAPSTDAAAQLRGVQPQTLKNEASRAYKKLGVRSRTAAFQRLGWLRA